MFDKEYSFRGKHCDYVIKLTAEYDGKRHKLFPTNYDVYEIAPIIGFLYGRQAELDKSGDATKIFPDKLLKEQQNLLFNYRLIMILDKNHEPDLNERLNKAFRYYGTDKTDKADFSSQCAPVVGRISCGPLEEAEEDLEEFVALPTALFGSGDFMILRASGESMIERGIDSGDLVVIEKNVTPRDGDIVAIREGSGNTLKQFFYEPDKKRIKLHPWNSTMKDIYLHDLDNVQIYGVARKVIKEL